MASRTAAREAAKAHREFVGHVNARAIARIEALHETSGNLDHPTGVYVNEFVEALRETIADTGNGMVPYSHLTALLLDWERSAQDLHRTAGTGDKSGRRTARAFVFIGALGHVLGMLDRLDRQGEHRINLFR